jgi:antitoxin (DNA-binding transcriptional repressor) of toxin-antitoxin stability system
VPEVSATEAARYFADLLDGVEQRGERYRIVRRGKVIAQLEPVGRGRGEGAKAALRRHPPDAGWRDELAKLRRLLSVEERP